MAGRVVPQEDLLAAGRVALLAVGRTVVPVATAAVAVPMVDCSAVFTIVCITAVATPVVAVTVALVVHRAEAGAMVVPVAQAVALRVVGVVVQIPPTILQV